MFLVLVVAAFLEKEKRAGFVEHQFAAQVLIESPEVRQMVVQQVVKRVGAQLGTVAVPRITHNHPAGLELPVDRGAVGRQDLFEAARRL